jgi:hypothetical protein
VRSIEQVSDLKTTAFGSSPTAGFLLANWTNVRGALGRVAQMGYFDQV